MDSPRLPTIVSRHIQQGLSHVKTKQRTHEPLQVREEVLPYWQQALGGIINEQRRDGHAKSTKSTGGKA